MVRAGDASDAAAIEVLDRLVFTSLRTAIRTPIGEIYAVNADGSGLTNLTNHAANDRTPVWSPDGTRIAFVSDRGGSEQLHVMKADGGGAVQVTDITNSGMAYPVWSPEGARIAFASVQGTGVVVYVINADGSGLTRLTNNIYVNVAPGWRPRP